MLANPLWDAAADVQSAPAGRCCAECCWRTPDPAPAPARCLRHDDAPVDDAWPACPAFGAALDCQACGACCTQGFDCVEVARDDPFAQDHADLLIEDFGQLQLPRPGGRCVCLEGALPKLSCRLYAQRPRSCRDFPTGAGTCLDARRRVGLTP